MTVFYNDLIINKPEGRNRELMKFFPIRKIIYFIRITRETNQSQ